MMSLGVGGHEGEGGEGFEGIGAGVDVLGDPEGVVAKGLDGSGVVDDGLPRVLVGLVEGHAEGEFGHGERWLRGGPHQPPGGNGFPPARPVLLNIKNAALFLCLFV